jgi:hypothetical protein
MRNSLLSASIVTIVFGMVVIAALGAHAESPLVVKVESAIRSAEPGWRYIRAVLSAPPPLVPSERLLVLDTWDHPSGRGTRESVDVMISQVDSRTDGKLSLSPVREGKVAKDWTVETFRIGDEGYLCTFTNAGRLAIHFRKGMIVVRVSGDWFPLVKEFAQLVAAQIDTT